VEIVIHEGRVVEIKKRAECGWETPKQPGPATVSSKAETLFRSPHTKPEIAGDEPATYIRT
jgi:hypothetical protein